MEERLILGDSNILIHLKNAQSVDHVVTQLAVRILENSGAILMYTSQNLAEFWNVCTRVAVGGLGLSIEEAAARVELVEAHFVFLPESSRTDKIYKDLLVRYRVSGVQAHDARLAAVMLSNSVKEILTFDKNDFRRYSEIKVIHPTEVLT